MQFTDPTTRVSLILRLNNRQDAEAWEEFVAIYHPMIWRIAKRLGMSDVDASDACQNTMFRLTQVVHKWSPSENNATFRGWLYRVARNCMLRQFEKNIKQAQTISDDESQNYFEQMAAEPDNSDSAYQLEFQRQVFANAAEKVRPTFNNVYWQSFWLTYVKNNDIKDVAKILDTTVSTVYVARSRVLKRIRDEVVRVSQSGLISLPAGESDGVDDPRIEPQVASKQKQQQAGGKDV